MNRSRNYRTSFHPTPQEGTDWCLSTPNTTEYLRKFLITHLVPEQMSKMYLIVSWGVCTSLGCESVRGRGCIPFPVCGMAPSTPSWLQQFQSRNVDSRNYLPTADHSSMTFMLFMTWRKSFQRTFLNFITSVKRFPFSIALSFIAMHKIRIKVCTTSTKSKQPG